jgi:branched-chain amino acid transport system permease protein
VLVYRTLVRPMAGRPPTSAVLLTVALGIMLQGLVVLIWTPRIQYPADALGIVDRPIGVALGGVISSLGVVSVVTCVLVPVALVGFLRYSRLGVQMLAAAENPLLLAQRGVDVHRLIGPAWGLAAVSGVLPGAVLVALAEVAAVQFVSPQLSEAMPFLLLLVALLVRPWGVCGTPEQIERV